MIDARYLQRRISQKFLYAKQLLALGESEAVREAVSSHLHIAYKAWLIEICHDRHHPLGVEGDSAIDIAKLTDVHVPAVLAECVQLEQNPESWLSVLLSSAEAASDIINKPPARALPGQIALNTVTTGPRLATVDELITAVTAFQQFLDRYRESMQEF